MNRCEPCLSYEVPECLEILILDFAFVQSDEYIVTIENHFGSKEKISVTAGYSSGLWIFATDLPDGYFFRGNDYEVKVYDSEENFRCDTPVELCTVDAIAYTCLTLRVKDIATDEVDVLLNCCE